MPKSRSTKKRRRAAEESKINDETTQDTLSNTGSDEDTQMNDKTVVVDSKSLKVRVKRINVEKKTQSKGENVEESQPVDSKDDKVEESNKKMVVESDVDATDEENENEEVDFITLIKNKEEEERNEYYETIRFSKMFKASRETAFYNIRQLMERHRIGPYYKDYNTNTIQIISNFVIPESTSVATIPDPDHPELNIINPDLVVPNGYVRNKALPGDWSEELNDPKEGVYRSIMDGYTQELKKELDYHRKITPDRNLYDNWQEQFFSQWKTLQPVSSLTHGYSP